MRRTLFLACTFLPAYLAICQTSPTLLAIPAPVPEEVCAFNAHLEDANHAVPYQMISGKQSARTATFEVTYNAGENEPWPEEAITAFEYAVSIWESHISSSIPIQVQANWSDFGGCNLASGTVLGSAGPTFLIQQSFGGQTALFPVALANAIADQDVLPQSDDLRANFNRSCDDSDSNFWYFGTDANTPNGTIDFVTVVLHELGHGLGFLGSANYDNGTGNVECNGVAGSGCLRATPFVYDLFAFDAPANGTSLLNTELYPNPSLALGDLFIGESNAGIYFDGSSTQFANNDEAALLYTPATWSSGSSYSHLDESSFNGTTSALMTPSVQSNEALHQPGAVTCGIFGDMGWPLGTDCEILLPVSLTSFEYQLDGASVVLFWETASETNNAGFEIEQQQPNNEDWVTLGFVSGQGTTILPQNYQYQVERLIPGTHRFRLKQIDFDGAFTYSPVQYIDVSLSVPFTWTPAHPNPFNPTTSFSFTVASDQRVAIDVYDAMGRKVRTLYDETAMARNEQLVRFDASGLASGMYWIRAQGTNFYETQKTIVLK